MKWKQYIQVLKIGNEVKGPVYHLIMIYKIFLDEKFPAPYSASGPYLAPCSWKVLTYYRLKKFIIL